jgi:quercetin dioxygenase-like cupin family protein
MAAYRLTADEEGKTHLAPYDLFDWPFENGPGDFKGVGGAVLGDATRVMLMRFEVGARPGFHRAVPSFGVVVAGEIVVTDSTGQDVRLVVGDAIRVETTGRGGWRLGNRGDEMALLALVQMPPKRASEPASEA